ncbi:hypothetical protein U1Q18_003475 [Sarracenia purpurea var. burkii]
MTGVLSVESKAIDLSRDTWVRIKIGTYKGDLAKAVEVSLRSANLLNGGVADKQPGKYSGGMKRRLRVSIQIDFSNSLYVICLGIYSCA